MKISFSPARKPQHDTILNTSIFTEKSNTTKVPEKETSEFQKWSQKIQHKQAIWVIFLYHQEGITPQNSTHNEAQHNSVLKSFEKNG